MRVKEILEKNREMIVEKYQEGISTCELGRRLNCSNAAVYLFLRDVCKISIRKVTNIEDYREDIIKLYKEGKSGYYIANKLGLVSSTISRYLKKLKLDVSHNSKIREDFICNHTDEIIKLYLGGMGCYKLSKMFNCAESSILRLLQANDIESHMYLVKHSVDKYFFDRINTEEKAYIYGYFVGDGNNGRNGSVSFTSIDQEILEKIKVAMQFTGPIYHSVVGGNSQDIYRLCMGCRYMSNRLIDIGCPPNKSFLTKFPSLDIVSRHLMKHYIRGLVDSDGSLYQNKIEKNYPWRCMIAGTDVLLSGIKDFVDNELDIVCRIYPHDSIYILRVVAHQHLWKFINWLYTDSTIYLDRKYALTQQILEQYAPID